jgi:hypothetical protein
MVWGNYLGILWSFGNEYEKIIMIVTNLSCQLRGYLLPDDPPFSLSKFCVVCQVLRSMQRWWTWLMEMLLSRSIVPSKACSCLHSNPETLAKNFSHFFEHANQSIDLKLQLCFIIKLSMNFNICYFGQMCKCLQKLDLKLVS